MTITLEQIQGMNIPVGTPIELTLKTRIKVKGSNPQEKATYQELGYFMGVDKRILNRYNSLVYSQRKGLFKNEISHNIDLIKEIKVLKYQE